MTGKNKAFLSDKSALGEQAQHYLRIRALEQRLLTDDVVRRLPAVEPDNPDRRLWRWRTRSLNRLIRYLQQRPAGGPLRLLDVGCGNGWMSAAFARRLGAEVWALDINEPELEQARRLFGSLGIRFLSADLFKAELPDRYFDVLVFSGSIQYFSDISQLKKRCHLLLKHGGEWHITDSNLYLHEAARDKARQASILYFSRQGVPEMAQFYHHHLQKDVGGVNKNAGWRHWLRSKCKLDSGFGWWVLGGEELRN